jgi:predicted phosphodiesterase
MRVLLSADFEGNFTRLYQEVSNYTSEMICVCCGDIFDYHHPPTDDFEFPIPFFSVKGNKELWGGEKLNRKLSKIKNFHWLNNHRDTLENLTGLRFYGLDHMHEPKEIPPNIDVLISHRPAFWIADQCNNPRQARMFDHCGSKAIKSLLEEFKPKIFVAGHIHKFQYQKTESTFAITLGTSLNDPSVMLEGKKLIIGNQIIKEFS